ncbi:putative Tau-tubulin kinase [Blattamonas nauphoetae]|uniref:non-specific serine/threonine protein kinase n=1 Tax=Blattamonas nauphoetae TaxID=2049346 RepID=A0ABQ9YIG4_9EUKA|nr:putative Tau-tubulin kinase [Blattamonas nauphoetae]
MSRGGTTHFQPGDVIQQHFILRKRLGTGGFGDIFQATSTLKRKPIEVALKVDVYEPTDNWLGKEVQTLSVVGGKPHFPKFIHSGIDGHYFFYAMELLGPNLYEIRKKQRTRTFSIQTTVNVVIQLLEAVQTLHNCGFIHRDIKPMNVVIGGPSKAMHDLYLIDYGLCIPVLSREQYQETLYEESNIIGTFHYCSPTTHHRRECGRRDDIISLLYMAVEMRLGKLPWAGVTDMKELRKVKDSYCSEILMEGLPPEFAEIFMDVLGLQATTAPDYARYLKLLKQVQKRLSFNNRTPFDWEISQPRASIPYKSPIKATKSDPVQ